MNGIDISGHQRGIDLSKIPCDFVIIKATQGASYVNPDFTRATKQAFEEGKLVGLYHYISGVGAQYEARHFVSIISPYIGRALICLDWESQSNSKWGYVNYCLEIANLVYQSTGVLPVLYMSKSVCRDYKWSSSAAMFPLWMAQYKNKNVTKYQNSPWTDNKGLGVWAGFVIHQYSSTGRLEGCDSVLDLDKAYCTADQWIRLCTPNTATDRANPQRIVTANVLNIRKEASAKSSDMGDLVKGSVITIDDIKDGWGHFEGWVNLKYTS